MYILPRWLGYRTLAFERSTYEGVIFMCRLGIYRYLHMDVTTRADLDMAQEYMSKVGAGEAANA